MATEVKLPRLGQGMDEGKILQWLKSEGDTVAKGDEFYEVETEKVNVEVEAPVDGTILKIAVSAGETVPIGTPIAWIGEPGESIPESAPKPAPTPKSDLAPESAPQAPAPASPAAAAPVSSTATSSSGSRPSSSTGSDRIKASPLARRMAREQNLKIEEITGSGPDGRIIARDVNAALAAQESVSAAPGIDMAGVTRVELTSMRKTIARRLGEAWEAPAFYLTRDINMAASNELRQRMLDRINAGDTRPTVSDIITKAAAVALRRHRDMNAHFTDEAILRFDAANIGMAVATDAGLVVPVIRDAHLKTVREIAEDRVELVNKARDGRLLPEDFEGGTFTISNLGMMGIDEFTAVLNPPMAGILAVGRTADRAVVEHGRVEVRPMMTVTLGCDHRAVDGAVGARFLQTLVEHLEDPMSMI